LYNWIHVEELAPIHAIYWRRNLRYEIINYHKKRALTVQGDNYDDIQSKLRQYKNPLFKEIPTLITNSCTCQVNFEYEPSPEDSQNYFTFRSENVHKIKECVVQVIIFNPWKTGSVYINSKQKINLFKGINAICFCFFQYRFQKFKEYFGDNNRYNIELTGGPLYRLIQVHTKNKYKAYFILYRKYHTCIDYTSKGDIPTLLELSKSALITGNISYTHPGFADFRKGIPVSLELAPIYPLNIKIRYFDYLFYRFNGTNGQCHSCTANKISHFLPLSENKFNTGNCV
jgi:hypothetical protein